MVDMKLRNDNTSPGVNGLEGNKGHVDLIFVNPADEVNAFYDGAEGAGLYGNYLRDGTVTMAENCFLSVGRRIFGSLDDG